MDQIAYSARDKRAMWTGRAVAVRVPDLVNVIVSPFDPDTVVLFGSVVVNQWNQS